MCDLVEMSISFTVQCRQMYSKGFDSQMADDLRDIFNAKDLLSANKRL